MSDDAARTRVPSDIRRRAARISGESLDERDRLIQALVARVSELEATCHETEERVRERTEIVANLSHELRTPLSSILGFLQLILEGSVEDAAEQRMFLLRAHASGRRLLEMIGHVLDATKLDSGMMEIELEDVSLDEVFEEVMTLEMPLAQLKKVSLSEFRPLGLTVRGDAGRLKQVLINLVANAVKFTPGNGHVVMKAIPGGRHVEIEVTDDGIGIAKERQAAIFERFVQAEGATTGRKFGGSGLGLFISRQLVKLMGSDLSVESEIDHGARFFFRLPLVSA